LKQFLRIQGHLQIPRDLAVVQELIELARQGAANWFRAVPVPPELGGLQLEAVEDCLSPGEEHEFLDFLYMLGQKYTGKISGEFEVWWPMAIESGPQWWNLEPDGVLYITESDIIRGERKPYKEQS
jgi:hypothetical protein